MATIDTPMADYYSERDHQVWKDHVAKTHPAPPPQVTEVYDQMQGFLKSTHWSKPYYSALVHNNPQLPYHLLEHVNCTYLSTPGRAPTLLALKQHAQSLAVLISLLAPAQHGGTLKAPGDEKTIGDAPFAAEQAFDWLNNLHEHYSTEDRAHKKPLNALVNLVKSNSDTTGPKWHCPLDTTGTEFPEKHPFPQYRPFESHMTLLMHANEILERLDHEYSAMGGILGIIPLDSENVEEQRALSRAKTTLVGQWILYTQHLVARMHELEIAYGNSLDLLANEAIVPMQSIGIAGPDGRSGREIVFPQDRWIMANSGEDVFTYIHRMLDRAEAHQDAQDDKFAEHKVLGDAAYSGNENLKYRGIVKVDLSTRFYRLRGNGHGPLFVLPAFGDRTNTKHTRDMENRPTVVAIPQPHTTESVNAWESKHKDVDEEILKLSIQKSNLEGKVAQLQSSVGMRDREIERLNEAQKQYDEKISKADKDLAKEVVYLRENVQYFQKLVKEGEEREESLKEDLQNFKDANIASQNNENVVTPLVNKVNDQQSQIRELQKQIKEGEKKNEDLARDNDTLRILNTSPLNSRAAASPEQVTQLKAQLSGLQQERQMLQSEVHNLKKTKTVKGKILNFPDGFRFGKSGVFEDINANIAACSVDAYRSLLAAEQERNELKKTLDDGVLASHTRQEELTTLRSECSRLRDENAELRATCETTTPSKIINLPWKLQFASVYRDDNQGLVAINTDFFDHLMQCDKNIGDFRDAIKNLEHQVKQLKAPVDIDFIGKLPQALGSSQSKIYKDTKRNIVVLTADYYDSLSAGDHDTVATQQALKTSKQKVQVLEQHLRDAREQLAKAQSGMDTELPDLQNQRDMLESQLSKALAQRVELERKIMKISSNTPVSALHTQVHNVQKELVEVTKNTEEKDAELTELQGRYKALQMNETNLRREVGGLRQKLYDATKQQKGAAGLSKQQKEELESARQEAELYREELETIQKLWNDLQTQHIVLQTELSQAKESCDEEKAHLEQKLKESASEIKVLQMKVLADPNKVKPAMIELEAQRNAAYKNRDAARLRIKELETELNAAQATK
ncbi:hypothetical protein F5B22DRAFT_650312 [Xylaria bambusicola]|uniref:uncharacterized protein n=1 Tax=Xylaria bambusicola TaxID=326684 RepID=UPI0020089A28|nr:uncharacterized protein F5B22DRAFT_650312 [Xylaria bambusicola]KAI0506831.1 hypothetical protein F5B22DRAFT_650312 [Xylaria bambusicola]